MLLARGEQAIIKGLKEQIIRSLSKRMCKMPLSTMPDAYSLVRRWEWGS